MNKVKMLTLWEKLVTVVIWVHPLHLPIYTFLASTLPAKFSDLQNFNRKLETKTLFLPPLVALVLFCKQHERHFKHKRNVKVFSSSRLLFTYICFDVHFKK